MSPKNLKWRQILGWTNNYIKVVFISLACLHKSYVEAWKTVEEPIVSLELNWFKDRVGIVDEKTILRQH